MHTISIFPSPFTTHTLSSFPSYHFLHTHFPPFSLTVFYTLYVSLLPLILLYLPVSLITCSLYPLLNLLCLPFSLTTYPPPIFSTVLFYNLFYSTSTSFSVTTILPVPCFSFFTTCSLYFIALSNILHLGIYFLRVTLI